MTSLKPAGSFALTRNLMTYILALDQGTTSSRAILFDALGNPSQAFQHEFCQIFPHPGWVEHDAMEIWHSQLKVAQQLFANAENKTGVQPDQIAAIAITNQRETTVLWDRATGVPLANAIVWQDRRTNDYCESLRKEGKQALIQSKTGLMLDAYFSATKLRWLLDSIPGARDRAERGELAFGTIDTWLIWNLTAGQVHVTDPSNASRTMLFNIHSLDWDDALLDLFSIPRALMPTVVPSSGVLGMTDPALFGQAIPIASLIGDQQAATFGQACFKPGMAKITYGTGCFMLLNTGTAPVTSMNRLLTTIGWQYPAATTPSETACSTARQDVTYCIEGSVFMGGAIVQWLRDGLEIIRSADEVETLAASVPDVDDTYLVPAFTGLGAPFWDGDARGTIIGMTRGTTRAHLARAALESIALQVTDMLNAMTKDSGIALTEIRVDGGASKNNLLMQMQADFLGIPVVRPQVTETTALGAAYLAGLAVGFWTDLSVIASQWAVEHRFEPTMDAATRAAKLKRWTQALDRARDWAKD
jgi:glycerol kinase